MALYFRRFYRFIRKDDSFLAWIIDILLAFVIVKFLIYPGLGFVLNTDLPVVAVVSGSMDHRTLNPCLQRDFTGQCINENKGIYEICGNKFEEKQKSDLDSYWVICGGFYEDYGISKEEFSKYPFKNGFNKGDIMVIWRRGNIEIGDIIVYESGRYRYPIIHRLINKEPYITKGDHNQFDDGVEISEKDIYGEAIFKIPWLGWVKIWFTQLLSIILEVFRI